MLLVDEMTLWQQQELMTYVCVNYFASATLNLCVITKYSDVVPLRRQ